MAKEKLTPKQEAFVLAYLECGNATQAYRVAYDADGMTAASIDKEARRLLSNPRITPRLDQLHKKVEAKALLSLEEHMSELRNLRELAKQNAQISAAIKAEELRGKLRRFYVEQIETGGPGDFEAMSDDELQEYIAAEAKALQIPQHAGRKNGTKH
jgi:phage terminase small subunit